MSIPGVKTILYLIAPISVFLSMVQWIYSNFMRAFRETKVQCIIIFTIGVGFNCGTLILMSFLRLLNNVETILIVGIIDNSIRAIIQYVYMRHKYKKKFAEGIIHFRKGEKYDITLH